MIPSLHYTNAGKPVATKQIRPGLYVAEAGTATVKWFEESPDAHLAALANCLQELRRELAEANTEIAKLKLERDAALMALTEQNRERVVAA